MSLFNSSLDYVKDIFRNIRGIKESQDLFDDLSSDPRDWEAAIRLEMETHPPLHQEQMIQRAFDYSKNDFIDYPFQHITSSRYSDGSFPLWYGSETLETSIHETLHHFLKEIEDAPAAFTDINIIRTDRRVGMIHCAGIALDLVDKLHEYSWLTHPEDYTPCQQIGKRIAEEGHPLLRVPSARHAAGINLVVFHAGILSNPKPYCGLTYVYDLQGGESSVYRGERLLLQREVLK